LLRNGFVAAAAMLAVVPVQAAELASMTMKDIRYLPRTLAETGEAPARALVFVDSACRDSDAALAVAVALESLEAAEGVVFLLINTGASDSIRQMAYHALVNE